MRAWVKMARLVVLTVVYVQHDRARNRVALRPAVHAEVTAVSADFVVRSTCAANTYASCQTQ